MCVCAADPPRYSHLSSLLRAIIASQRELCKEKRVPGFPTWEIQGKQYPGEKDLAELEAILDAAGVP